MRHAQAKQSQDGYERHPTNNRLYIARTQDNRSFNIIKLGHGHKQLRSGKLSKSTTRYVATERFSARPQVISAPTLHALIARLHATNAVELLNTQIGRE